MNRLQTPIVSLALCAVLSLFAPAHAADLGKTCAYADGLADTLASVARERGEAATVAVQFELRGTKISNVQLSGASLAHQRAVRRALSGLGCNATTAQTMRFDVQFINPSAQAQALAKSGDTVNKFSTTTAALR